MEWSVEKVHGSSDGNSYNFMEIESMEVFRHVGTSLCRRVRRSFLSSRYSLRRIASTSFNPSEAAIGETFSSRTCRQNRADYEHVLDSREISYPRLVLIDHSLQQKETSMI